MNVLQGQVVFLLFPFSDGSGAKVRPALVLQSNPQNERLTSTVVAMISSNVKLVGREPGHILIDVEADDGRESGLKYSSAINVHAIYTIHTDRIERIAGRVSNDLLRQVIEQLVETFALSIS